MYFHSEFQSKRTQIFGLTTGPCDLQQKGRLWARYQVTQCLESTPLVKVLRTINMSHFQNSSTPCMQNFNNLGGGGALATKWLPAARHLSPKGPWRSAPNHKKIRGPPAHKNSPNFLPKNYPKFFLSSPFAHQAKPTVVIINFSESLRTIKLGIFAS